MRRWFYLQKGRPHGPFREDVIRTAIAAGQLRPTDMLYLENDTVWRPLNQFSEFGSGDKTRTIATPIEELSRTTQLADQFQPPSLEETRKRLANSKKHKTGHAKPDRQWVILVKKETGKGFKQKGPLATDDIWDLLKNKSISGSDYVWKEGFTEWQQIKKVPELTPSELEVRPPEVAMPDDFKPSSEQTATSLDINPTRTSIANVPTQVGFSPPPIEHNERASQIKIDQKINENNTPSKLNLETFIGTQTLIEHQKDLTRTQAQSQTHSHAHIHTHSLTPTRTDLRDETRRTIRPGKLRRRKKREDPFIIRISGLRAFLDLSPVRKGLVLGITLGLLGFLVFSQNWLSSYWDRRRLKMLPPSTGYISSNLGQVPESQIPDITPAPVAPSVPMPTTASPASPVAPPTNVRRAPTYVNLQTVNNTTTQAEVRVLTDGSTHFPITLQVKSSVGDIVDFKNYKNKFVLSGADRTFYPSSRRLPWGEYQLTATIGTVNTEGRLAFGTAGPEFAQRLRKYKKSIVFLYNEERINFIKTTFRLERELFKFIQTLEQTNNSSAWVSFYRPWSKTFAKISSRELDIISEKRRREFVHADDWLELKNRRREIERSIYVLHKNKTSNQPADAKGLRQATREIVALREQMIRSSLWR